MSSAHPRLVSTGASHTRCGGPRLAGHRRAAEGIAAESRARGPAIGAKILELPDGHGARRRAEPGSVGMNIRLRPIGPVDRPGIGDRQDAWFQLERRLIDVSRVVQRGRLPRARPGGVRQGRPAIPGVVTPAPRREVGPRPAGVGRRPGPAVGKPPAWRVKIRIGVRIERDERAPDTAGIAPNRVAPQCGRRRIIHGSPLRPRDNDHVRRNGLRVHAACQHKSCAQGESEEPSFRTLTRHGHPRRRQRYRSSP